MSHEHDWQMVAAHPRVCRKCGEREGAVPEADPEDAKDDDLDAIYLAARREDRVGFLDALATYVINRDRDRRGAVPEAGSRPGTKPCGCLPPYEFCVRCDDDEVLPEAGSPEGLRAALLLAHDHHEFGPEDCTPANCSAEAAIQTFADRMEHKGRAWHEVRAAASPAAPETPRTRVVITESEHDFAVAEKVYDEEPG